MRQDAVAYTINNITFNISNEEMLNISSVDTKQPEYNLARNCTAALGYLFDVHRTWFVIPCSKTFTATYFCQSELLLPDFNFRSELNPINSICGEGWLMLADRPMCYLLLKPDKAISFDEGYRECSSRNASIYKVTLSPEPDIDDTWLKTWFQIEYEKVLLKSIPKVYSKNNLLRKLIFGTLLDNRKIENNLGQSAGMHQMLAGVTDKCGIIESIPNQGMMKIGNRRLHSRWFYKNRPCSKLYNISVLVCEKESHVYSYVCSSVQFRCMDGTCVLLVYRCDGLADCFDASDELACSYDNTDNLISPIDGLSYNLECLLYLNCKGTRFSMFSIHAVCDGIYTQQLRTEHELCRTNHLNHLYSPIMTGREEKEIYDKGVEKRTIDLREVFYIFMKEMSSSLHKNDSYSSQNWINSNETLTITQYLTECQQNGEQRSIAKMCKISAHIPACRFDLASSICMLIWCPGMFKCHYSYCLPMSLVCDGHYDCADGEDELFCSNLLCPGLLKCRGENKCVSFDELCDGQVNCRFTFDDEITCRKCPPGCICFYYLMSCEVTGTFKDILSTRSYLKGLVVKGSLINITSQEIVFYSELIYINISFCGLENVLVVRTFKVNPPRILFVDFNHNSLSQVKFLSSELFSCVVYVDLSHNMIYLITSKLIQMKYLEVLKIGDNPLQEIFMMLRNTMHLRIIDISHVHYTDKVDIYLSTFHHEFIEIHVTDPTLCCVWNSRCKIVDGGAAEYMCNQLIKKLVAKWIFYTLTIIAFITCNAGFFIILLRFSSNNKNIKYYKITIINQSLTELSWTTYFICIFFIDALNINVIFWIRSVLCLIINAQFYLALSNCIIFKAFSAIMISLKIKFPFKHQCRWFRFIYLSVILVWIFGALLYSANIGLSFYFQGQFPILDIFCRFGECNKKLRIPSIYFFIICIDVVFTFLFFGYGIQAYIALKANNTNKETTKQRGRFFAVLIIIKMGRIFVIELFCKLVLYILIFAKKTSTPMNEYYCFLFFLFTLPIDVILSNVIGLMQK